MQALQENVDLCVKGKEAVVLQLVQKTLFIK